MKTDSYEDILRKTRDESLGERVRGRILAGNYFLLEEWVTPRRRAEESLPFRFRNYDKYFVHSQRVRRAVVNDYKKVFEEDRVDCLLAPVVSSDPPALDAYEVSDTIFSHDDQFTVGANLAGQSVWNTLSFVSGERISSVI